MKIALPVGLAIAGALTWPSPVRADDDAATVAARLAAAAAGVRSFVVQLGTASRPNVTTLTFVRPMQVKFTSTVDAGAGDGYLIDGMMYFTASAGGWSRTPLVAAHVPAESLDVGDLLRAAQIVLLPDRGDPDGAVGMVRIVPKSTDAPGSAPVPTVCSYDKTTYLLASCVSGGVTTTYTKYNDPSNAVVLPREAKRAPLVTTPAEPAALPPAP
jgi:hypothetical protein